MTAYVEELAAAAAAVVGDAVVGVYPHGSLMLGGWSPERSDVDVLVVVSRTLTSSEKDALASAFTSIPCPAVGLELSIVLADVVAHPTERSAFELHVTTAPDDAKVVDGTGHPGDWDLVLHFAVCHALGHPGFPSVARPMLLGRLAHELAWAAEHNPSAYAVLNACRALRYAEDGSLVSKVDGGRWALDRLTGLDLDLVRAALAVQTGESTDPVDSSAASELALRIRDVIRSGRSGDQNV